MESNSPSREPHEAISELTAADQARERLATGLQLPHGLHPLLAVTVAAQVGTAAVGIAEQTTVGLGIALAGLAGFLGVVGWLVHRFQVINGVRVDGLTSQVVLGASAASSGIYLVSLGAATWAAFESQWWLVALASAIGGVAYALGARRWWHAYRDDPAAHVGGASPRVLAALAAIACLGLAVLVVAR